MMEWLGVALLELSNALLGPALVGALALFSLALFEIGTLLADLRARARQRPAARALVRVLRTGSDQARRERLDAYLALELIPEGTVFALSKLGSSAHRAPAREHALEAAHRESERRLARLAAAVRLGPLTGLMGTLIPLAPGLVALADGDLSTMASHMRVAFTVTVVGLATAAIAYVVMSVRRSVDAEDLADLTLVADCLAELAPKETST